MIPDWKGEKLMGIVSKSVIYDDTRTGEGDYIAMHDKSLYEVEYPDRKPEELAAAIISENIMSHVDSEGHHYQVLTEVTDHKKDNSAIAKVDGFIKSSSGNLHQKRTTLGWKLLVEWKDVSVDWFPLNDLKQSNPVEMAEYDMTNEISDEPTFNWCVKETSRHRDRIISKVKYKY